MIVGSAIGLTSLAKTGGEPASGETTRTSAITTAKVIHQEEDFKANAQRIYEALLDSEPFTAFSGGPPRGVD